MHTGPRLLLVAALVTGAGAAVPAAPAHAAACEQGRGVTVVVDFASLGGGIDTDCAPGDPGSGIEALRASGHEPARAAQQPGYFVCRIDGRPASDPCQRASPADAYWSYWHARPGGSWSYRSVGPADADPAPGTVEGWAFGDGDPPSVAPPKERTASAPAPSRTRAASSPAAAAPPSPAASPSRVPPRAAAAAAASPAASPAGATATPRSASAASQPAAVSAAASAAPSPTRSAPPSVAVDRAADGEDGGGGSLVGPLATLGVVLLLAAAGAYQVQQRRSRNAAR